MKPAARFFLLLLPSLAAVSLSVPPARASAERAAPPPPAGREADCECMDLVFVLDFTGSMDTTAPIRAIIRASVAGALTLVDVIAPCTGRLAAGAIRLCDVGDIVSPLESDLPRIIEGIGEIDPCLGPDEGNTPANEAVKEPTREEFRPASGFSGEECVEPFDHSRYREGCCKDVVLVTDGPPGGCDLIFDDPEDREEAYAVASQAAANGFRVHTIYVPTGDPDSLAAIDILLNYAETTGASFTHAEEDGSGIAEAMQAVVAQLTCTGPTATDPESWGRVKGRFRP